MGSSTYAFTHGLDYASIVAASEHVAWTVDAVFRDRRFDASKPLVPASWVRTQDLAFLTDQDHLTLNHCRAFSYAHLNGNYEEFIPLHLAGIVQQDWHAERTHLRALLRFGEEELKHQQLFRRTETVLEASCGHPFGRYLDEGKARVTALTRAVLAYAPATAISPAVGVRMRDPAPLRRVDSGSRRGGWRPALCGCPQGALARGSAACQG